MAQFLVVRRPSPGAPESTWETKLINFTPVGGRPAREEGIAAIKAAFGEKEGTYFYAPASAFGSIVATKSTQVTYV